MTTAHHGKAFHGGEHYENFPVGSWLVPKTIRPAVLALYRFARTGDDLADEGQMPQADRVDRLMALRHGLNGKPSGDFPDLVEIGRALRAALDSYGVPHGWADDLLTAFLMDVDHQPMASDDQVLDYCQYSAAPVGRLVLGLSGLLDRHGQPEEFRTESDAICTGLQLANFAQDLGQDIRRGRCYLPAPWWPAGWSPALGIDGLSDKDRRRLATDMASWAGRCLNQGASLPKRIRASQCHGAWRLAMEIAVTIEGGRAICQQVLANPAAVWHQSPKISKAKLVLVVLRAIRLL
jgi:hydroxysqualene synthase